MKNLIILPNAIGDIILSSELIKNCNYSGWVILVKEDFYKWVKSFYTINIYLISQII